MTNLLILPGNSPKNKKLLDTYSEYFEDKDLNIISLPWKHWSDNTKDFVDDSEVERIIETIKSNAGDFHIIAKSVGTILFSKALNQFDHSIIRSITFLGLPISGRTNKFKIYCNVLNELHDIPITFIQARNDPYATFDEVTTFTREILHNNEIKLKEIDRDDHVYPIEDVKKVISSLI